MPDDCILGNKPNPDPLFYDMSTGQKNFKPNPDLLFYDMFTGQKNFLLALCASVLASTDFTIESAVENAQKILDLIAKKESK